MASAKLGVASLPLLANITAAYGTSYAGLISAFAEALVPGFEPPEQRRDDDEYGDEDYDEDYDEEYDEDYDENDEYDADEDYDDEQYDGFVADINDYENDIGFDDDRDRDQFKSDDQNLEVEVNVLQEAVVGQRSKSIPIRNGDVLTENDNYKIQMTCNMDCYAYVAQLDAVGRMDPIVPSSLVELRNPLSVDTTYSAPAGNNWFYLDSSKGIEQIYFIFSRTPRKDIELIFEQLTEANKTLVAKEQISIQQPLKLTRGIAGVRTGSAKKIELASGEQSEYMSTVLESIEAELVITKWFRHQ
jgi:hypothetical protein